MQSGADHGAEGAGADGLEAYHSDHDEATQRHYKTLAKSRKKLVTGGSDFHGMREGVVFHGGVGNRTVDAGVIELLLAGGTFVPTDILLGATSDGPSSDAGLSRPMNGLETLTTRELEVLKGVARGRSNKEIAREMNLAEVTVKLHLRSIFRKIGVRNRSEAAVAATRSGVG